MRRLSFVAVTLAVGLGLGCAHGTGSSKDQSVISGAELNQRDWRNCYEVVETLRPFWLVKRGPKAGGYAEEIWVYEGNVRLGGVETLRGISASNVISLQFLDMSSAQQRWGPGHMHGVILVEMR
jgi:hypothetical protein